MYRKPNSILNDLLGIEGEIATKALIVAAVSGVLAAILDRVTNLPRESLLFAFSEFVVAINGPIYALFKGKDTLAGAIMAAVSGVVTLLMWWLTAKIIGTSKLANPADAYNLFKLFLEGALVGLIGFGWFALMHRLPGIFTH